MATASASGTADGAADLTVTANQTAGAGSLGAGGGDGADSTLVDAVIGMTRRVIVNAGWYHTTGHLK